MINIRYFTFHPEYNQLMFEHNKNIFTPNHDGIMQNIQLISHDSPEINEWIFAEATHDLPDFQNTPKSKRIIAILEPQQLQTQSVNILNHYGFVMSPSPRPENYQGVWIIAPSSTTQFGKSYKPSQILNKMIQYQDIMQGLPKNKLLSMVSSIKLMTQDHLNRVRFMGHVGQILSGNIDIFCREIKPIDEKFDACAPYQYIIACENDIYDNYMTEKLRDGLICGCVVFYYGAPNVGEYYDMGNIIPINIKNPKGAVEIIVNTIRQNIFAKAQDAIMRNKIKAMEYHNIIRYVERIVNGDFPPDSQGNGNYRVV